MEVYVHVGPPKTGTSSIQAWLSKNRGVLQKFRIYYPEHPVDENGVSSGNLASLFDNYDSNKLTFSKEKFQLLKSICKSNNSKILLLSSEFFFQEINQIIAAIPEVKFIYYLRFELETLDSSYNQKVKRHNETDKFEAPQKGLSSNLRKLWQLLAKYPDQFIIRYFAPELFFGNDLIKDFLHCLKITNLNVESLGRVNSSYSPNAVEFKRKFNVLVDQDLLHQIDLMLQKNPPASFSYTFMAQEQYGLLKQEYISQLKSFFMRFPLHDFDLFLDYCRNTHVRISVPQEIDKDSFDKILHELLNHTEIEDSISRAIQVKRKALTTTFTETELDSLLRAVEQGKSVRTSLISKLLRFFRI